uniref:V-SNARE coiled-coil homology domain-containing protein n=1 Tax=Parascaris univalens TaxID=6257 RepID=A0A915C678_PARUN
MCLPLKKLLGLSTNEKVYLDANQFEHKGPLKIEVDSEVKIAKVYDIGPDVEIAPQA